MKPPGKKASRRERSKLWPLLVILVVEGAFLGVVYLLAVRYAAVPRLVASDVIALPGSSVELGVRADEDLPPSLDSKLSGFEARFVPDVAEAGVGSPAPLVGIIDASGLAGVAWTAPESEGVYAFRVHVGDGGSGATGGAQMARLRVFVVPSGRSLVVTTARSTLLGPPLPPAASAARSGVFRELASKHAIVYVDVSPRPAPESARAVLDEGRFPPGPVLSVPVPVPSGDGEAVRKALRVFLDEEIKPRWTIDRSLTTRVAEFRAFAHARLRVMLVHPIGSPEVDGFRYLHVHDWRDALTRIQRSQNRP